MYWLYVLFYKNSFVFQPSDSGTAGSPEETDFDEPMLHEDYDDDVIFDSDVTNSQKLNTLLPRDSTDSEDDMIKFQHNFEERCNHVLLPNACSVITLVCFF